VYDHAVSDGCVARTSKCWRTFYLNRTNATDTSGREIWSMAQSWNMNTGFLCGFEYGQFFINSYFPAIDDNLDISHRNRPLPSEDYSARLQNAHFRPSVSAT
jgi:hypothetical protein